MTTGPIPSLMRLRDQLPIDSSQDPKPLFPDIKAVLKADLKQEDKDVAYGAIADLCKHEGNRSVFGCDEGISTWFPTISFQSLRALANLCADNPVNRKHLKEPVLRVCREYVLTAAEPTSLTTGLDVLINWSLDDEEYQRALFDAGLLKFILEEVRSIPQNHSAAFLSFLLESGELCNRLVMDGYFESTTNALRMATGETLQILLDCLRILADKDVEDQCLRMAMEWTWTLWSHLLNSPATIQASVTHLMAAITSSDSTRSYFLSQPRYLTHLKSQLQYSQADKDGWPLTAALLCVGNHARSDEASQKLFPLYIYRLIKLVSMEGLSMRSRHAALSGLRNFAVVPRHKAILGEMGLQTTLLGTLKEDHQLALISVTLLRMLTNNIVRNRSRTFSMMPALMEVFRDEKTARPVKCEIARIIIYLLPLQEELKQDVRDAISVLEEAKEFEVLAMEAKRGKAQVMERWGVAL